MPADSASRLKTAVMSWSDAQWEIHARKQFGHVTYFGKALGLPRTPEALFFTWVTPAASAGAFVSRSYTLETYIVGKLGTAGSAQPTLAKVGGVFLLAITYPTDPYLLVQRTGYACQNEVYN